MLTILIIAFFAILLFMFKNIFTIVFSINNMSNHKKRMKQLRFDKNSSLSEEDSTKNLIDKVTKPVIRHILPHLMMTDLDLIEKKLRLAKWNRFFTAIQYRAFIILLRILGTSLGIIFGFSSIYMGAIWFVALAVMPSFLLNNEVKNKKEELLMGFPDFIRITEGYLSAGYTFVDAVTETIPYVDKNWEPILQRFVLEAQLNNVEFALDMLKNEVDIFEVKEFVSLVRLAIEQGGEAKDSFTAQADKIRQLQMDIIEMKINKRKMYAVAVNGPVIIGIMIVFGLPVAESMTSLSTM